MKELDDLIKKVGNDKVLHFLGGGWICAIITFVVILQEGGSIGSWGKVSSVLIGTAVVVFLSVVKEIFLDDKADWIDVVAAVIGCVTIFASVGIGVFFNFLSA